MFMSDMTLESVCCHVGGDRSLAWSTVELCHYIMTHSCHVISSCHYFAYFYNGHSVRLHHES